MMTEKLIVNCHNCHHLLPINASLLRVNYPFWSEQTTGLVGSNRQRAPTNPSCIKKSTYLFCFLCCDKQSVLRMLAIPLDILYALDG